VYEAFYKLSSRARLPPLTEEELVELQSRPLENDQEWDPDQEGVVQALYSCSDDTWEVIRPFTLLVYYRPPEFQRKTLHDDAVPACPQPWDLFIVGFTIFDEQMGLWRVFGHQLEHQMDEISFSEELRLSLPFKLKPLQRDDDQTAWLRQNAVEESVFAGAHVERLPDELIATMRLYVPKIELEEGTNFEWIAEPLGGPRSAAAKLRRGRRLRLNLRLEDLAKNIACPPTMGKTEFYQRVQDFFNV